MKKKKNWMSLMCFLFFLLLSSCIRSYQHEAMLIRSDAKCEKRGGMRTLGSNGDVLVQVPEVIHFTLAGLVFVLNSRGSSPWLPSRKSQVLTKVINFLL